MIDEKELRECLEIVGRYHFESKTETDTAKDFTLVFKNFKALAEAYLAGELIGTKKLMSGGLEDVILKENILTYGACDTDTFVVVPYKKLAAAIRTYLTNHSEEEK